MFAWLRCGRPRRALADHPPAVRTPRLSLRVETLISMRFMAQRPCRFRSRPDEEGITTQRLGLMKKGLRLVVTKKVMTDIRLNGCPDGEGITTYTSTAYATFIRSATLSLL